MFVRVYAIDDGTQVSLEEPDDCGRFHLVCEIDVELLGAALVEANVGSLRDAETALINPEAIVRAAGGRVGADWGERFGAMIEFAESKGWMTDDGNVRAHVQAGGASWSG
jgi:hypothetical protein